jgi:hypothetical protein
MGLDKNLLGSLDLMFGRRLQSANLEEIPQVRVQTEHTPELFSFLEKHGILLATVELQGNTIIVRNLQRLKNYKPEVDGGNGPVAQENSDLDEPFICTFDYGYGWANPKITCYIVIPHSHHEDGTPCYL